MADPRQVGTFNLAFRPAPITSQPPNNDRSWPSQGSSRHARSSHLHDLPGRQHPHRKVLAQIHGQTPQHEPLSEAARQRLVHKVDNLLSSLLHASHHNHPMKLLALHPDKQIYHRTVAALVTFDRLLAQREGLAAREPTNASPDDDDASLLKDVLTKLKAYFEHPANAGVWTGRLVLFKGTAPIERLLSESNLLKTIEYLQYGTWRAFEFRSESRTSEHHWYTDLNETIHYNAATIAAYSENDIEENKAIGSTPRDPNEPRFMYWRWNAPAKLLEVYYREIVRTTWHSRDRTEHSIERDAGDTRGRTRSASSENVGKRHRDQSRSTSRTSARPVSRSRDGSEGLMRPSERRPDVKQVEVSPGPAPVRSIESPIDFTHEHKGGMIQPGNRERKYTYSILTMRADFDKKGQPWHEVDITEIEHDTDDLILRFGHIDGFIRLHGKQIPGYSPHEQARDGHFALQLPPNLGIDLNKSNWSWLFEVLFNRLQKPSKSRTEPDSKAQLDQDLDSRSREAKCKYLLSALRKSPGHAGPTIDVGKHKLTRQDMLEVFEAVKGSLADSHSNSWPCYAHCAMNMSEIHALGVELLWSKFAKFDGSKRAASYRQWADVFKKLLDDTTVSRTEKVRGDEYCMLTYRARPYLTEEYETKELYEFYCQKSRIPDTRNPVLTVRFIYEQAERLWICESELVRSGHEYKRFEDLGLIPPTSHFDAS